ncbi:hypothetical protein QUA86_00290 [Microcoleus sp. F6_B6]
MGIRAIWFNERANISFPFDSDLYPVISYQVRLITYKSYTGIGHRASGIGHRASGMMRPKYYNYSTGHDIISGYTAYDVNCQLSTRIYYSDANGFDIKSCRGGFTDNNCPKPTIS